MLYRSIPRLSRLAAGAAVLLGAFAPPSSAQETNPMVSVDYTYDSGVASNEGALEQIVISFLVDFTGADSMQVRFSEVELSGSIAAGTNSRLRITSVLDGAEQLMNARHLEQWQNRSAYFNGGVVLVEVLAFPGTGLNRVVTDSLLLGVSNGAYESQCGPTDDREPSSDPRVCRLMPVGCTAWMINDCGKCFLSAGHCSGGGGSSVQFNVPFSQSNGSLVFPPPSDQYAVDGASYQFLYSTDDWQYFGVFPNSTTGLTPFQAMGDAFDLATPPAPAGNSIRITGYGTDSTPNLTYNQVQQTHVGPLTGVGTNLTYQTDTTGGSSGSPIIWEEQDAAIGVHTNAGCTTGGGGSNNGTPITAVSLQNALANPKGVCSLGSGLANLGQAKSVAPFIRPPGLGGCGDLTPGSTLDIDLSITIPPAAVGYTMSAILVVGFSELSVPFLGGVLVPSWDFAVTVPVDSSVAGVFPINTSVVWPVGVPSGMQLWLQYWVPFDDGAGVADVLASNALVLTAP